MEEKDEERKLVKKAVRGNVQAYGELIERHKHYFYKIAFSYCGNEQDALDVVQESIVKGYRNIKKLRKEQYFSTWMTRILLNTAKDCLNKRRNDLDVEEMELSGGKDDDSWDSRMDVRKAVEELPEKYRTAVSLRFYQDLSVKEIAERMQVPPATVSTYLNRAKQMLKRQLKEEYGKENVV